MSQELRNRRNELNLTLRQLAEKTGVSHTHISEIENGKCAPSFETTMKLAKSLDMNPNSIVVDTYQSQLRQMLLEFIKVCHENNIRIPYEQWVKTNLPLQPLSLDENIVHDASLEIATKLYQQADKPTAELKLALIKQLLETKTDASVIQLLINLIQPLYQAELLLGKITVNAETKKFIEELNRLQQNSLNK
ncbi:helix-turn-helix domain-containing protein [Brevibacillus parabrevis]|uniref:helix-turn-helix domain-containing protein n=1 Tax=Brevibacillus parabrevis TaxID=54914 RepID=UPI001F608558|nr:helix-turn-helix domain-containing protein [Brevibacillus parabrevis]